MPVTEKRSVNKETILLHELISKIYDLWGIFKNNADTMWYFSPPFLQNNISKLSGILIIPKAKTLNMTDAQGMWKVNEKVNWIHLSPLTLVIKIARAY